MKVITMKKMTAFISTLFIFQLSAVATELTFGKSNLTERNYKYNWLKFSVTASNGKTYTGGITCYPANRTHYRVDVGTMNVLRSPSHSGVYTKFSYDECLDLLKSLDNDEEEVILTWDQDKFEDFVTGPLTFERVLK